MTITRTLFRDGESEYQINGVTCRLLDIQELLSDTGIGRQQHVIVGQGQLDEVLTAQPGDRRAVIEEAAGVLKFRKRRERAERRLEATEGNLLRLNDLVREVGRQLRPLEKQADAARRYGGRRSGAAPRSASTSPATRSPAARPASSACTTPATRPPSGSGGAAAAARARHRSVLDIEHSLTALGHDDAAEALVRPRRCGSGAGLRALLAEKQHGLERELTAAADEGVIETLVADADALRRELAEVDDESSALEPKLAGSTAEQELAVRHGPTAARGRPRRRGAPHRSRRASAKPKQRRADAARRPRPHAGEARAAGAEALADLDGVVGPLADHVELESGAEAAVAAGTGRRAASRRARRRRRRRAAIEHVKAGESRALLVADDFRRRVAHAGVCAGRRASARRVRASAPTRPRPGARAAPAGIVLVEGGWRPALDTRSPTRTSCRHPRRRPARRSGPGASAAGRHRQ